MWCSAKGQREKIHCVIVERRFPVKPGNEEHKWGSRQLDNADFLENCKVPKENCCTKRAWHIVRSTF